VTRPRSVFAMTLGCDKNLVDSEALLGRFGARGITHALDPDDADILVVNTCGFIEAARRDSFDAIAALCRVKGDRTLVVTGCLSQEHAGVIAERFPDVDLINGVGNFERLLDALEAREDIVPVGRPEDARYEGFADRPLLTPPHLAFVKISEGCNFRCSFCRIPFLRGNTDDDLLDLVASLDGITGLERLRLHYLYPGLITADRFRRILATPVVAPYVDMPVQHASPRILKRMSRPFDPAALASFFTALRADDPTITLRTTILLGFPGEEEEDVEQVADFLERIKFDHVGTYRYSPEAGTRGAEMTDVPDDEDVADREARIQDLQHDLSLGRQKTRLGGSQRVVVDEIAPVDDWRDIAADLLDAESEYRDTELTEVGRRLLSGESVAIARGDHQSHDVDGVTLIPAADLRAGQWLNARTLAINPYDALAVPAQGDG